MGLSDGVVLRPALTEPSRQSGEGKQLYGGRQEAAAEVELEFLGIDAETWGNLETVFVIVAIFPEWETVIPCFYADRNDVLRRKLI